MLLLLRLEWNLTGLLALEMKGKGMEFYSPGDWTGNGGGIAKAVKEGAYAGMAI